MGAGGGVGGMPGLQFLIPYGDDYHVGSFYNSSSPTGMIVMDALSTILHPLRG